MDLVMKRFPKLEKEKTCRLERELRNQARESYKKRLIEAERAKDILATGNTVTAKVTA